MKNRKVSRKQVEQAILQIRQHANEMWERTETALRDRGIYPEAPSAIDLFGVNQYEELLDRYKDQIYKLRNQEITKLRSLL